MPHPADTDKRRPVPLTQAQAELICAALNGEATKYEQLVNEHMIGQSVARVPATTVQVWDNHAKLLRALSRNVIEAFAKAEA